MDTQTSRPALKYFWNEWQAKEIVEGQERRKECKRIKESKDFLYDMFKSRGFFYNKVTTQKIMDWIK